MVTDWEKDPDPATLGFRVFAQGVRTVWSLSRQEHRQLGLAFGGLAAFTACDIAFSYLVKVLVDALVGVSRSGLSRTLMVVLGALLLVRLAGVLIQQFWAHRSFMNALIALENEWPGMCHKKLIELPMAWHQAHSMTRNAAKVTKGCEAAVSFLLQLFFDFAPAVFYWLLNLIMLLIMDWRLAGILAAPIPLALALQGWMNSVILPRWNDWEACKEQATSHLIQSVVLAGTVQACVQERHETSVQMGMRERMRGIDLLSVAFERPFFVAMNTCLLAGYFAAIGYSAYLVARHAMTVGMMTYIVSTGLATVQRFWQLIDVYKRVLRDVVRIERLAGLLAEHNELPLDDAAPKLEPCRGDLALEEVTFRHRGKDADHLSRVSVAIRPGSTVAFVGPSGAGKSTLINLLQRVYDPQSGRVTLDGQDARTLQRDWFRSLFAYVRQETAIFDRTLSENVAYGYPEAGAHNIIRALRAAHLLEVVNDPAAFPDGLKTLVGENGKQLSGGQRQRLSIARAYLQLLQGARFLVLDEATSSLDAETERGIQDMLAEFRRERPITVIMVAHRFSTVKDADCIHVIEGGRLVQSGTHHELVAAGGMYARLARLQNLQ